jgi:hypothetical protein
MNAALMNALSALYRAGARGLPSPDEVADGYNGKKWFGEKKDGSHWMLVKHGPQSYNVTC